MTHFLEYVDCQETYEYHGSTAIEWTRLLDGTVQKEWLLFDTVEEAVDYFNEQCI
jgi:hypothetical protein